MRTLGIIFTLWAFWPGAAAGETACLDAAAKAETQYKIPDKLLQAITLVETGRSEDGDLVAWPWTTNLNATGRYFDSKNEALRFVRNNIRDGESSIDVGCFQINTKWHGAQFASIDDMIDPEAAAEYAAKFLLGLKEEYGDWNTAAAKYHSRTPVFSNRYAKKLSVVQGKLLNENDKNNITTALLAGAAPPLRDGAALGGVALSIFLDARPIIDRREQRSLFDNAGSP